MINESYHIKWLKTNVHKNSQLLTEYNKFVEDWKNLKKSQIKLRNKKNTERIQMFNLQHLNSKSVTRQQANVLVNRLGLKDLYHKEVVEPNKKQIKEDTKVLDDYRKIKRKKIIEKYYFLIQNQT